MPRTPPRQPDPRLSNLVLEGGRSKVYPSATCRRCGGGRWPGLAPVCAACRDGYAEAIRQAALALTTAYLEDPGMTLDGLKPRLVALIETLDGVRR